MQSFRPIHFCDFKVPITKNGFGGLKSFQGFRETGLRVLNRMNRVIIIAIFFSSFLFIQEMQHQLGVSPFQHNPVFV